MLLASILGPPLGTYAVQISGTAFHRTGLLNPSLTYRPSPIYLTRYSKSTTQIGQLVVQVEYFIFKLMRSKGILNDAKRAKPMLTGLSLKKQTHSRPSMRPRPRAEASSEPDNTSLDADGVLPHTFQNRQVFPGAVHCPPVFGRHTIIVVAGSIL